MRILLLLSLLGCDEDVTSDKHASDTSSGTSPGHDSPIDPAVDTPGDVGRFQFSGGAFATCPACQNTAADNPRQ